MKNNLETIEAFMRTIKLISSIFAVLSLSACATIMTGTSQNVTLKAVDASNNQILSGVSCSITDSKANIYTVPGNPGSVLIHKGQGPLQFTCKKSGYTQKNVAVGENFNAVTLVNVLFWPGFIVDAATGTLQRYPSAIVVMMDRTGK
jgi:hypothetical protein